MCYAAPGPRCYGHADNRYAKAVDKINKTVSDIREGNAELRTLSTLQPHHLPKGTYHKRTKEANSKIEEAGARAQQERKVALELRDERDATKGGIHNLKSQIKSWEEGGMSKMSYDDVITVESFKKRLEKGTATYNKSLESYDDKNGTVNGRQGSPYGSIKGMQTLREKMKPVRDKLVEAQKTDDKVKKYQLLKKYSQMEDQLNHAQDTYNRVEDGKFDKYRASLAENKDELKRLNGKSGNKDNLSPADLDKKKRVLETAIAWGEMSDEDRLKAKSSSRLVA